MTTLLKLFHLRNINISTFQYLSCITNSSKRPSQIHILKRRYQPPPVVLDTEAKLKRKDQVPVLHELIYQIAEAKSMRTYLIINNMMALTTPLLILLIYCERNGIIHLSADTLLDTMAESAAFLPQKEVYICGVVMSLLCFIFNYYCTVHPLRIYFDAPSATYTAIFMNSIFPWRIYKHEFTKIQPSFLGLRFDKKTARVRPGFFKRPTDYYKFGG